MLGINPALHSDCTCGAQLDAGCRVGCLRSANRRTIIFADCGVRGGLGSASPQSADARPISILADLFRPFVGDRAQVAAHALFAAFGSLDRIVCASQSQLYRACGLDVDVAKMIVAARSLIEASLSESVRRSIVDPADPKLRSYLIAKVRTCPFEELHVIYTDLGKGFLAEEMIARGDDRAVEAGIVPIIRRAIDIGAANLLMFHNHPSRQPQPSKQDIAATQRLSMAASAVGLTILDHLIVAGNSVTSMRERGVM